MTMSSNQTTNGKLTNKDLTQIYGRYIHLNGMNDYPGQMHAGFTYSIIPALKKIYADNKEKRIDAYQRHMTEYFNVTVSWRLAPGCRPCYGRAKRRGR